MSERFIYKDGDRVVLKNNIFDFLSPRKAMAGRTMTVKCSGYFKDTDEYFYIFEEDDEFCYSEHEIAGYAYVSKPEISLSDLLEDV